MPAIGSKLTRAAPLSSAPASFEPKPLTRAKPLSEMTKPKGPDALKHPALPEGGPRYSPLVQNTGDAVATGVGSPASALRPEKSKLEKALSKAFGG